MMIKLRYLITSHDKICQEGCNFEFMATRGTVAVEFFANSKNSQNTTKSVYIMLASRV